MLRMVGMYLYSQLLSIVNCGNITDENWLMEDKWKTDVELSHFCDSSGIICYLYPTSQLQWALTMEGRLTAV